MPRRQKIDGIETVRRVFRRMPEESLRRVTNALNQGADEIVGKAREAAPRGQIPPHVQDTIRRTDIRLREDGKAAVVFVTAGDTAATANAAFRSEFGRDRGGTGANVGHPGHEEQPFMFPAYWSSRRRVRSRIKREIRRAARFVAGLRPKA